MDRSNEMLVAITGMGIVSSCGEGLVKFNDALKEGKSHFRQADNYLGLSFSLMGAFVSEFHFETALNAFNDFTSEKKGRLIKLAKTLPLPLQMGVLAGLEAVTNAHLDVAPIDPEGISVVVSAQNATGNYAYNLGTQFQADPGTLSPWTALHFMDSDNVGIFSELFKIKGEGFTVGGASASGNIALIKASQLIAERRQEACLVVGVLADLSPIELQAFYNVGALGGHHFHDRPNQACRPFDLAHEGFIYGQASACILLESLDSAEKRGVPILGYCLGGAIVLDSNRLTNPSCEGEARAMRQAMHMARIRPEQVSYINTHGTSAPQGDETELAAIREVFGSQSKAIFLNSTKSITGHCLWSAGIVEAIATVLQMQNGYLHPTLNLENPISSDFNFVQGKAYTGEITLALSNAFGFGGINTTLVLSKTPPNNA